MKVVGHTFPWMPLRGLPVKGRPYQHLVLDLWKPKNQRRLMGVESKSPLGVLAGPQEMRGAKDVVSVLWVFLEHGVNPTAQVHDACR